jgi:hypothetical protein
MYVWNRRLVGAFAVAAAVLLPSPSRAAETPSASPRPERTAGYFQGGFSTASPHMSGAAAGGSVVLHAGPRLAVEGSASYVDRGAGSSAASLSVSGILHLASRAEEAVPYLVAGAGLYRASFDTRIARFSGPAPSGPMGSGRYRHVMKGGPPDWDLGELPAFYGDRTADDIALRGRNGVLAFNDPAVSLGAGMRVRLGRRWSMRQDARAQLVMRNGQVYALGVFTIQVGRGF